MHELNLKVGEWVEVRTKEEILATLDDRGCFEKLPFMPEMLEYCGRRFCVDKRAHKTCDFSQRMQARKLTGTVHLKGVSCNGAAHGNCQAVCLIFWKEAWLKRAASGAANAGMRDSAPASEPALSAPKATASAAEEVIWKNAVISEAGDDGGGPRYSCQATTILNFTQPLRLRDLSQYVEARRSGNFTIPAMIPTIIFRFYRKLMNLGIGWGPALLWLYDAFQKARGGIPYPSRPGLIPIGSKTPRGVPLQVQPGEWVRVKSHEEILTTIDATGKNRGLIFSQEMVPYCGRTFKVHSRVNRIIDEKTGGMLEFKNECIILENVICRGRYNEGLMFCPRSTLAYWREIWLERATEPGTASPTEAGCKG